MDVQSFDDFDEMFERMQRDREAADARVQPWQAAIKPGDYFQRNSGYGFHIYGEVLPDPEPREEFLKHYRFCKAYSVACADGELGDVHVSTIDKLIEKTVFEDARKRGWSP